MSDVLPVGWSAVSEHRRNSKALMPGTESHPPTLSFDDPEGRHALYYSTICCRLTETNILCAGVSDAVFHWRGRATAVLW